LLTPEESIKSQNDIGADIMMALDDVVSSVETDRDRILEAHIAHSDGLTGVLLRTSARMTRIFSASFRATWTPTYGSSRCGR